jgi:choline dehydrogenase-like flavoprotein
MAGQGVQRRKVLQLLAAAAGGVFEGADDHPQTPGYSLHETGTCRMGNDPKQFVTNRFGQTHDGDNLYVCDASVLRTSEYIVQRQRDRSADA